MNTVSPVLCDNCGEPVTLQHKHSEKECQEKSMTYAVPLKVKIRLTVWDTDEDTGQKSIRDIKEEEVFFGEIPLMTDNGTFIINGTERVIVSQLASLARHLLRESQQQYLLPCQGHSVSRLVG